MSRMTPLTFDILLALSDADRHGYGIIKEIEARGVDAPSTGALYLALQRMESSALIEPAPEPAGPDTDARRKYYRITGEGRRQAEEESARLAALVATAQAKRLLPDSAAGGAG